MNRMGALNWILASALAAGGAGALAHESPREKTKIIIVDERRVVEGSDKAGPPGEAPAIAMARCSADKALFSDSAEEKAVEGKSRKTRILICSRGDASAAERAKRLEQALARIKANEDLSPETRTRIATALREAIDRLNGTH